MRALLLGILLIIGAVAHAEEDTVSTTIGEDVFAAGFAPRHADGVAEDVFIAGNTVSVTAPAMGDAALAGQTVTVSADIGDDLYITAQSINVSGAVGGDANLFGQDIRVGNVGGNLRSAGASVVVDGDVAGYAILGGAYVEITGTIGGDVHLGAERVQFADTASITGTLHIYEDEDNPLELDGLNISGVSIERHATEEFPDETRGFVLKSFLSGIVVIALIAALIAAVAPQRLAEMRRGLLGSPFRSLWVGFLGLSVLAGAGIIAATTIIGLILLPAFALVAVLTAFAGYVVGAYSLGVGLMLAVGMDEPETLLHRAGAALLGALSAAIVALAPFLGWIFVMALVMIGTGALLQSIFRPRFFAEA